jgi:hypothetical protein
MNEGMNEGMLNKMHYSRRNKQKSACIKVLEKGNGYAALPISGSTDHSKSSQDATLSKNRQEHLPIDMSIE